MKKIKEIKNCNSCINGIRINVNNDILCRIKGAVSHDFVCTKYRSAPLRKYLEDNKYKCIDCEFFICEEDGSLGSVKTGYCQLFTVRLFNGEYKNACSRFSKKRERVVS